MILSKSTSKHSSCLYQIMCTIRNTGYIMYTHIYIYIYIYVSTYLYIYIYRNTNPWFILASFQAMGPGWRMSMPMETHQSMVDRPDRINMHKLFLDRAIMCIYIIHIYIYICICTLPRPLFHTESVTTQLLATVPKRRYRNTMKYLSQNPGERKILKAKQEKPLCVRKHGIRNSWIFPSYIWVFSSSHGY